MVASKKTVGLMLGGVAVGVGLGMVLAPRPGKETREALRRKFFSKKQYQNGATIAAARS